MIEANFFTVQIERRIKGQLMIAISLFAMFAALSILIYLGYTDTGLNDKKALIGTLFFFSIFIIIVFVPSIYYLISYIIAKRKYKNGLIPFCKIMLDNGIYDIKTIVQQINDEYADKKVLFNSTKKEGASKIGQIVVLPSYVIIFGNKIILIPTKNIVWAYGETTKYNSIVNGIRFSKRFYQILLFYKGITSRNCIINLQVLSLKTLKSGEELLQALTACAPYMLVGKSKDLYAMYKKDQTRLATFFEKYQKKIYNQ